MTRTIKMSKGNDEKMRRYRQPSVGMTTIAKVISRQIPIIQNACNHPSWKENKDVKLLMMKSNIYLSKKFGNSSLIDYISLFTGQLSLCLVS